MTSETLLEQRVQAVEQAITDIQRRLAVGPDPSGWLEKVIGSITDESAFREALRYGRDFREADRPGDVADES